VSPWAEPNEDQPSTLLDDINTYLNEPALPKTSIAAAGGAMKWWYAQEALRPRVALMAMDFISAPREFSLELCCTVLIMLHSELYRMRAAVLCWTSFNERLAT
jgi:hypothetical protein